MRARVASRWSLVGSLFPSLMVLSPSLGTLGCSGPAGPAGAAAPMVDGGAGASGQGGTSAGTGGGANGGSPGTGGAGLGTSVTVLVALDAPTHAISPLIYGINGATAGEATKARLVRLGGNHLTAYSWETNASNGGNLEGFQNFALSTGTAPGAAITEVLKTAAAHGASAHLTVPIGDYVAADHDAGDVHGSGASYLTTRFRKNVAHKPTPLAASPDLGDDSVFQDELTAWVKGQAGTTPVLFSLDNQPELWSADHAESHPNPSTYADVIARNIAFATAIKGAWPDAPITGYASYGWQGFVNLQNAPDAPAAGTFVTAYLDAMKQAEADHGGRLLDYLDLHWWPEAQGAGVRIIGPDAGPEVQAARVQAPRSLWDVAYHETSWIDAQLANTGESIELIPRARGWIGDHYPGTKLAFSAWYYGGGGDVSGAIATADVLGIFGRDGVDLAALDLPVGADDSFTMAGLRAFLDYDGHDAHFGDLSVKTTSSDPIGLTVYASVDSSDATRVVVVAINKRLAPQTLALSFTGGSAYAGAAVYALDATAPSFSARPMMTATAPGAFSLSVPGSSITVVVPQ